MDFARRTTEPYRQLVEAAYEGIIAFDTQGQVTYANARIGAMLGYGPDEIVGRSIFHIIDPNAHAEAQQCIEKRWRGVSEHHELRLLRKDGTVLWVNVAGSPLYEKNAITGGLAICSDLTQRKAAKTRLQRVSRWHALSSNINEAIVRVPNTSTLYESIVRIMVETGKASLAWIGRWHPGFTRLECMTSYGRDNGFLEEVIGLNNKTGGNAEGKRRLLAGLPFFINRSPQLLAEIRGRGFAATAIFPIAIPDAELGFLGVYADEQNYFDEDIGVLNALMQNISFAIHSKEKEKERLRAEAQRREAEEKIAAQAALLDKAKDAIVLSALDGTISYWNKGAERLYGWAPQEAVGRSLFDLVYEDKAPLQRALDQLLRAGEWSGELHQCTRSGEERYVEASWTLLRDEHGKPRSLLSISSDITARKQLESQFLRAQRLESVGTLAGGIAHDFNNIVAAIAGNARLAVADLPLDHPVQTSLAEIEKASARAADLVRQILTFSRQQAPSRRVVSLRVIVEETLRLLRATLPANIDIRTHWNAAPAVLADPIQLHQIVMNLGTNAAHAMASLGGVLQVEIDAVMLDQDQAAKLGATAAGPHALLVVKDTGMGMERAVLARAFEPFFTTKPPGQGSGLGLSVVHGIMQSHQGVIAVDTVANEGTTFKLYFPAVSAETSQPQPRVLEPLQGHGKRVLYVDDEEPLVFLIKRSLERLGYQVAGYTSPIQALEVFKADSMQFDAVITDLAMPDLAGPDLARELLRLRPNLPIIAVSGYVRPEDEALMSQVGARELVHKPDTVEELARALHRAINSIRG